MNVLVTGGAGFIGSNLVDRLVARGDRVTVYDNLSSGREAFIADHLRRGRVTLRKSDLLNFSNLCDALKDQEMVFHLAANPDIRVSLHQTKLDVTQ